MKLTCFVSEALLLDLGGNESYSTDNSTLVRGWLCRSSYGSTNTNRASRGGAGAAA